MAHPGQSQRVGVVKAFPPVDAGPVRGFEDSQGNTHPADNRVTEALGSLPPTSPQPRPAHPPDLCGFLQGAGVLLASGLPAEAAGTVGVRGYQEQARVDTVAVDAYASQQSGRGPHHTEPIGQDALSCPLTRVEHEVTGVTRSPNSAGATGLSSPTKFQQDKNWARAKQGREVRRLLGTTHIRGPLWCRWLQGSLGTGT